MIKQVRLLLEEEGKERLPSPRKRSPFEDECVKWRKS